MGKEMKFLGRLGSDINNLQNGGGYVNIAISKWGALPDGTYGVKTMWVTVYLTDAQVAYCNEKGIKKGTAVNVLGRFDYSMTTSPKDGKQYLSINVNPYSIVKARGGHGGICLAMIDDVRLTEDIIVNENGTGRVRAAFDTIVKDKTETRWITLLLNESVLKRAQGYKLKKGSHIDLVGEITIEQNSYNGKEYVNASIQVGNLGYAANAGRPTTANEATTANEDAPSAPVTEAPTTAPTGPSSEVSADDFGSTTTGPAPEVSADDFSSTATDDPFEW